MAGWIDRIGSQRHRHDADAANDRSVRRFRRMTELMVGRDRPVTDVEIARYQHYMEAGDSLADALAQWMATAGFRHGMETFEHALEHGIEGVADAPACLRDFFAVMEQRPEWLDEDLIRQGQRVINRTGIALPFLLGELFLLGGYGVSAAMNQALVMTGALRDGSARKRTVETSAWWLAVTREGGLERDQTGFHLTARVRLLHAVVRRKLVGDPDWDRATHGLPINQAHMAATGHAFGAGSLVAARISGARFTPRERQAYMHLWRYANHLMGVDPALNGSTELEGMRIIQLAAMTAPAKNDLALELAESYVKQVQYRFPRLGLPGRVISRCIGNGRLGLAWLGLGRDAYRRLGLPEQRAWIPLTLASIGVLNARETLRRMVPASESFFIRAGRRLQELQIDWLRDPDDRPDRFVPYDARTPTEASPTAKMRVTAPDPGVLAIET